MSDYLERSSRHQTNRENAQHSTGPTTPEGKAISAQNAIKHGLTGNTVLIASDDADQYQDRLNYYTGLYQPTSLEERRLVQAIHDANWRLDRIMNLESTIFAKGRIELDSYYCELPADHHKSFVQLEITSRYAKELRNLSVQESRIQRQRFRDLNELKALQAERRQKEADENEKAEAAAAKPLAAKPSLPLAGFVFAPAETTSRITIHNPAAPPAQLPKQDG